MQDALMGIIPLSASVGHVGLDVLAQRSLAQSVNLHLVKTVHIVMNLKTEIITPVAALKDLREGIVRASSSRAAQTRVCIMQLASITLWDHHMNIIVPANKVSG